MDDISQDATYLIRFYHQLCIYHGLIEAVKKLLYQEDTKVQRVIQKEFRSLLVLVNNALEQKGNPENEDFDIFLKYINSYNPNVTTLLEELGEEEPRSIDEPLPLCFGDRDLIMEEKGVIYGEATLTTGDFEHLQE